MIALTRAMIGHEDEVALIGCVREHGIAQGKVVALFEQRVAKYLCGRGGVATNSGTSALILGLRAIGVGAGDEVIFPSYTCIAILHAVAQVGAIPILADNGCDANRMDYNMAADNIRRVLTSRTRAVIVPHMFGVPARIDEIVDIGVPVIEDITLSLGARYKDRPVGSYGAVAICSFHQSKMIACGEGGMLIAGSDAIYQRARYLNSWDTEQASQRFVGTQPPQYELRYNFHLSDLAAAVGLAQFERLNDFIERRRLLAGQYTERFKGIEGVAAPQPDSGQNIFYRYIVSLHRREVIPVLKDYQEAGIEAGRGVYPALHQILRSDPSMFPGAESAVAANLSVPLYPALTDEEAAYILEQTPRILAS